MEQLSHRSDFLQTKTYIASCILLIPSIPFLSVAYFSFKCARMTVIFAITVYMKNILLFSVTVHIYSEFVGFKFQSKLISRHAGITLIPSRAATYFNSLAFDVPSNSQ
jgi:Na+/pantothenate symporter